MRHLENVANGTHNRGHLRYLKHLYPRNQRWAIGAALVTIARELVEEMETDRCKGYAALNRGGLTRQMWVVKRPVAGYRKGDKVLNERLKDHLQEQGATFRSIRYPRAKKVKRACKRMAKAMSVCSHPRQFGFVPQRDCVQSAREHSDARVVYLLDLEDAFEQVTKADVYEILHDVFLINPKDAKLIAHLACHKGRLYQGNPMAPVLFNLRATWMTERLTRLCRSCGCKVSVYADDLTLSSEHWEYFSSGFRKTVVRIIRECGFKVNRDKSKVAKVSPRKLGHYDITGLTVDFDQVGVPYVRPLHRKRTLRKADYLRRIRGQGAVFSDERAADGSLKSLEMVETGLRKWAERKGQPSDQPRLALQYR